MRPLIRGKGLKVGTVDMAVDRTMFSPTRQLAPRRGCVTIDAILLYNPSVDEEHAHAHGTRQRHQALLRSHGGYPLLFSHEFAGDYRSWEPQVRYFPDAIR